MALVPCARCQRHVFADARACPFCLATTTLAVASIAVAAAACHRDPPPAPVADDAAVATTPGIPTAAPRDTIGEPSPTSTGLSAADQRKMLEALGGDGAADSDGGGLGLGSIGKLGAGDLRLQGAVYGPAPSTRGDGGAQRGLADISPPTTTKPVPNAERVVAGLRPRFRMCFNRALEEDPSLTGGAITITAKIKANGEVESATAKSSAKLPASLTQCLTRVVTNAQFDEPGAPATLTIPINLGKAQ